MRESTIERYLVRRVKALGGEVRKVQWIGRIGAPDRVVLGLHRTHWHNGVEIRVQRPVWVELKAPGKKPEAHQVREHKKLRQRGEDVVVIDSLEGVDALLA